MMLTAWLKAAEFQVDQVIHPVVAKLGPPAFYLEEPKMFAISTGNEKAAKHVKQGMALFNAPWDFEAYRHFCAAAQADPDCLMAYWGIVMSLAGNQTEFFKERTAALNRLGALLEVKPEIGVPLERGYALAAVALMLENATQAGQIYHSIAKEFPNDLQSQLLGHFLMRDGYDANGKPRARQEQVNAAMNELMRKHGDHPALLSFWVTGISEAPMETVRLKTEALPAARKLAKNAPEFPPFQLLAAHLESRCGNAKLAISYAEKARDLYASYMKEQGVELADCGGWVRAQIYLGHLFAVKGEFEKAVTIANELAQIEIQKERVFSKGNSLLLWEGRTLGARLYASRSTTSSFDAGIKSLSLLSKQQWYESESLVNNYRDGLVLYLGARKALVANDLKGAKNLLGQLMKRAEVMARERNLARETSSYSEWFRAMSTLSVLVSELQGMIAEKASGAMKLAAVNWYQSAIEQQSFSASLLPPSLSYPMEMRLGWFYIYGGKKKEAEEILIQGFKRRPGHLGTLTAYQEVLERLGKKAEAAHVKRTIELVRK